MDFKVLGCHGGESPKHQCPAFLLDGRVCLDAGSITNMLTLKEQQKIDAVIVSHAHIDHVRDLAMLADTRTQQGGPPLTIASTPGTIAVLKKHFFNDKLWPDFSKIPDPQNRTVVFQTLAPGKVSEIGGYRVQPIPVDHTVEAAALIVSRRQDLGLLQRRYRPDREALVGAARADGPERADHGGRVSERPGAAGRRLRPPHAAQPGAASCASSTASSATCRCCCSTSSRCSSGRSRRSSAKIRARNNTILQIGDEYVL